MNHEITLNPWCNVQAGRNLIEKESAEEQILYVYDSENHLIRAETSRYGATIVVEYQYDDAGNRVRKTIDNNLVINYLVDTNRDYAQVVEERDQDGNLLVRYVYGHDLISQTRPSAGSGTVTSYYHYDGLGSTRELTSSAGIVTDTYTYDAFGLLLEQTGTTENAYRYRGEQFDDELGFYYLRARYMNPNIGRFVTMDEFAGLSKDPVTLHKYLYANANPITYSDPSGYFSLAEAQVAGSVRGILANIQIDIGMAIFNQIVFGGNSGLSGLMMGGAFRIAGSYGGTLLKAAIGRLARTRTGGAVLKRISPFIAAHLCKLKSLSPILAGFALQEYHKMQEALEKGDIKAGLKAFYKSMGFMMSAITVWRSFACFPEGTLIATREGNRPIQDIKEGDEVYSENVETGEQGFKRVKKVFVRETRVLMHLFLDDVEIITTPEHPFWIPEQGWIPAGDLNIGEFVKLASGTQLRIKSVTREVLTKPVIVYNFEVEGWHTYFVGDPSILVHNTYRVEKLGLRGKPLKWIKRQKPKTWKQVPTRNRRGRLTKGWKWIDENGIERLRFMRPNGKNPANSQWSRQANGYFRWQNANEQFLDIDGNIVTLPSSDPLFSELTHIMYEGPL